MKKIVKIICISLISLSFLYLIFPKKYGTVTYLSGYDGYTATAKNDFCYGFLTPYVGTLSISYFTTSNQPVPYKLCFGVLIAKVNKNILMH